jgi:hypothetical protein
MSEREWQSIYELFAEPPQSALQERLLIRRAIARFERITGEHTPTHNDLAGNASLFSADGQMDCVDESTNTTTHLLLLEEHGLLRWHKVVARAMRVHYFLDLHFTAPISELDTETMYAIDSWHRANGEPPYVQKYAAWLLKPGHSKVENPPLRGGHSARQ